MNLAAEVTRKIAVGEGPAPGSRLSDGISLDQRLFLVRYRDTGEYLAGAKRTDFQTVRWVYRWTREHAKARKFTYDELAVRGPEALSAKEQDKSLLMNLTVGYGRSIYLERIR